eukprot:Gb_10470 [translate_table: standard]
MGSDEEEEFGKGSMGSRCEWHPGTVACLLNSYGDKCANIKGYLKIKDWEEIVRNVNAQCEGSKTPKTMKQCRDKVENLKRRYKLEKRRADTRGLSSVNWSFFDKLDEIMGSLNKSGNVMEGQSFELNEGMDCELPDGFAGESMPMMSMSDMVLSVFGGDKGKGLIENGDCSLDDILNTVGYSCKNRMGRIDFQETSPEKPSKRKKSSSNSPIGGISDRISKKRKAKDTNPVQSLADAVVGFSEVYARIEIAKMEMFTKLILELAKLHGKKRKKSDSASTQPDPK